MLSILITHYNRPKPLRACIDSLRAIDWKIPYEIVVSDDGSTKENIALVEELNIDTLLFAKSNQGLGASINKGIKACKGDFILYCQEDAIISKDIDQVLQECYQFLENKQLDMIRFRANYKFPKLIRLTEKINRIPHFSFKNFYVNTFQYSDNPFITTRQFFNKYGFFLEGVTGPYGETEYAIRTISLKAKIGITKTTYALWQKEVSSIINTQVQIKHRKGSKKLWRFARALRQHIEWLLYTPSKRKLNTYKNKPKK